MGDNTGGAEGRRRHEYGLNAPYRNDEQSIYGGRRSRVWCSAHNRTTANPTNAMVTAVTAKTLSRGMIVFPLWRKNYGRAANRLLDPDQTSEQTIAGPWRSKFDLSQSVGLPSAHGFLRCGAVRMEELI